MLLTPISSTKTNPAAATSPQQPVTAGLVALMLSALLMLTESFAASMPLAQRALSVLLLAFGCSQLIKGPLSDHFDRRPTSLCGLLACECTAPVKAAAR